MIVVGIDSTSKRSYEYGVYRDTISDPRLSQSARLPLFLANEVTPFVVPPGDVAPTQTGIGGTSLGGISALHVLLSRPDRFGIGLWKAPLFQQATVKSFATPSFGRAQIAFPSELVLLNSKDHRPKGSPRPYV
jgi:enterochelin esterase-like enzyme